MVSEMEIFMIGAGVVGAATGKGLIKMGKNVTFIDTNISVVKGLRGEGHQAYLPADPGLQSCIPDIVLVSVPTPQLPDGKVDLTALKLVIDFCGKQISRSLWGEHPVVVIRSTIPPGTCRDYVIPRLEELTQSKHGEDFSVCFNPEFLRAVSAEEDFLNPWLIVCGVADTAGRDAVLRMYDGQEVSPTFTVLEVAELIKYASNCFNATKISYANELWRLTSHMGLDGNEVLGLARRAAEGYWNPKYGTMGGQPYGGTCLPKDTTGLSYFANQIGIDMPLLQAVIRVNEQMKELAEMGQIGDATIEGPYRLDAEAAMIGD